jgi:hypothetical protein
MPIFICAAIEIIGSEDAQYVTKFGVRIRRFTAWAARLIFACRKRLRNVKHVQEIVPKYKHRPENEIATQTSLKSQREIQGSPDFNLCTLKDL